MHFVFTLSAERFCRLFDRCYTTAERFCCSKTQATTVAAPVLKTPPATLLLHLPLSFASSICRKHGDSNDVFENGSLPERLSETAGFRQNQPCADQPATNNGPVFTKRQFRTTNLFHESEGILKGKIHTSESLQNCRTDLHSGNASMEKEKLIRKTKACFSLQ